MHNIYTLDEMTQTARGWLSGGTVGFVPTMGSLHGGHISLIQASQAECEMTVVSIFVNPLRFRSQEEFLRYPRGLERDLQLLRDMEVDVVFLPRAEDMRPPTFATAVTLRGAVAQRLEAAHNPRFVEGVATEMTKFLHLIRPDVAYLGLKDAQRVAIVQQLVRDLSIDVRLRVLPSVREPDGLVMSSQNALLTAQERQQAVALYQALVAGRAAIERGESQVAVIKQAMIDTLARYPLVTLEYVDLCDPQTFVERGELAPNMLLAVAASLGEVRLVDTILFVDGKQWHM
jgi:pantoate--beta-alanine ligase